MPWIEWCHPLVHISIYSHTVIKNVPNIVIFKSPSTDSFFYSQNIVQEGRFTYSIRWIRWHCPFGCTGAGSLTVIKNVPNIAIFKSPSTDCFIYCQNVLKVWGWTYSMRWIWWWCPFVHMCPRSSSIVKNVQNSPIYKSPCTDYFFNSQNIVQ